MRIRRVRVLLPARFASTAAADARVIVEAAVRRLETTGATSKVIRAELPSAGRDVRALASAVANAVASQGGGR